MQYPCKNCTNRYPACHDACKDYLTVKATIDEAKAKEKRGKDAGDYIIEKVVKNNDRKNKNIRQQRHHVR